MSAATIEGYVENGQIRLPSNVHLPERAKVYVVVPDADSRSPAFHVGSPRLVHPEQSVDFLKKVTREQP